MSREAAFWNWYAQTNDSVRHELIERGWYGREVTDNTAPAYLQEAAEPSKHPDTVWQQESMQASQAEDLSHDPQLDIQSPEIEEPDIGPEPD